MVREVVYAKEKQCKKTPETYLELFRLYLAIQFSVEYSQILEHVEEATFKAKRNV